MSIRFDQLECVVCYEKIGHAFCIDCKQSSAICYTCIDEYQTSNGHNEIDCVVCRKPMTYQKLVDELDCSWYDGDDWTHRIFVERLRGTDKAFKLFDIMLKNYNEW